MNIFLNKYLYILLFLIILKTLIKLYDRFPYVKKDQDFDAYLHALHNYYVTNIYYEYFIFFVYVLSYFGLFLFIRIKLLGHNLDLLAISLGNFTFTSLINVLIYILCIIFYINIINMLFYPNLIKLYYYFYQFEWFEEIVDNMHMNFNFVSNILFKLASLPYRLTVPKKDYDRFITYTLETARLLHGHDKQAMEKIENSYKEEELLWYKMHNNILLLLLSSLLAHLLYKGHDHISRQLRSISYPILLGVLLWDIHKGTFYYIYYALFIYFLSRWIKKVRCFLSVRDPLEKAITDYFYSNEIPYLKIKDLLDNNDLAKVFNNIGEHTKTLLGYKDELIPYILNNFVVYHVRYPIRSRNEKYLNDHARRLNLMILMVLGIMYYYINSSKYTLLLLDVKENIYIVLTMLIIPLYFTYVRIPYHNDDPGVHSNEVTILWGEIKGYKQLFRLILLIMAIPMLYIMLKNKLTIFPNETILDIPSYIRITEIYTLEEKKKYLWTYLEIITKALDILPAWEEISQKVHKEIIIDDNTTLNMIRNNVENLISNWISDYKPKKQDIIMDGIKTLIDKLKKWITK